MIAEAAMSERYAMPPGEPQPSAADPVSPAPRDVDYPGTIVLRVDATDIDRRIFQVAETIPVAAPGPMILFFPKWLPGYHSPRSPIEKFAGLVITAGGVELAWRRDPVEVYAFHLEVPEGADALELRFQFLSPTTDAQGDVAVTPQMLNLHWNTTVLYPAGHYARRIAVDAGVTLPDGWTLACALEQAASDGATTTFAPVGLDRLLDSPLFAGRHYRTVDLDDGGKVRLNLFADRADQLAATDDQITPHRDLVAEVDALFGARHFDHFDFLMALSDQLGGGGVERHRSAEIVMPADYFTQWDRNQPKRDVVGHEYVHSWNGKHRRGVDNWTPSFDVPIRNSLMWVYEGLTQYWGQVLAARSGLWTVDATLGAIARSAAIYANRPGGAWRPLSDTTRDPVITGREPQPWPSWQRAEDYYSEGALLWLDVDTLIRERTGEARSLDDFARAFFGMNDGEMETSLYRFEDVVEALADIAPHDWTDFLNEWLEARAAGTTLDGLERGGYRLVYRDSPNNFAIQEDSLNNVVNVRFSVGLTVASGGVLQEVLWDSPAFMAGLTSGTEIVAVNGGDYTADGLRRAIAETARKPGIDLVIRRAGEVQRVTVDYDGGHRYPHLERIEGARLRLDDILAPRRG